MTPEQRRARRSWIVPILLVALIALPIIEVWLLIQVGRHLGLAPTLVILVIAAALGAWLTRREGSRAWRALNEAFGTGRMPARELADAALILVGGVLLMLPGFLTDVLGLFCLLPFTRPVARKLLGYVIARRVRRSGLVPRRTKEDLIEGQVVPDPAAPTVISGEIEQYPPNTP